MLLLTGSSWLRAFSLVCIALLIHGELPVLAQQASTPGATTSKLSADQLDSLVAPIVLYPDPLLAQVLAASTYPLEIVQLQQWLVKNQQLKDKELADAVQKQSWDPSIQGLAVFPDVVKQFFDNIKWTSELGNAFLAQQSEVMDAVQRMRAKATASGKLSSNEQIKVETRVVEQKSVVVIEQADPQVVYVPSYDPVYVWGSPVYPYPYYPGYYAAGLALSFGVGIAMGAFWSGGWGYGCGWGGNNNININNNNNFIRNGNIGRSGGVGGVGGVGGPGGIGGPGGRGGVGGGNRPSQWQHNPQHRGGAPYGDRGTADRFGGMTRGDRGNRQARASQNFSQRSGQGLGNSRGVGGSGIGSSSGIGRSNGIGSSSGLSSRTGGGDRIGNRQTAGSHSRSGGAFGGSGAGGGARVGGSRGSSSFGGSRGGGSRGGGRRR